MLPLEAICIQVSASSPARRRVESMLPASRPRHASEPSAICRAEDWPAASCDVGVTCCSSLAPGLSPRCVDSDGDGLADGVDPDDDNDGVSDALDPAPLNPAIGRKPNPPRDEGSEPRSPASGRWFPDFMSTVGKTLDLWA